MVFGDIFDTVTVHLTRVRCCHETCGVYFALEKGYAEDRKKDHKLWHCPNGHEQFFSGKNVEEKLKEQLALKEQELARADLEKIRLKANYETATRGRAIIRGRMQKLKVRIAHGVCPCCSRSFQNLMRHMKTKHPKYKADER